MAIELWMDIAKVLVIPTTVVIVVLILRPLLREMLGRLTKLEVSGFEFGNIRGMSQFMGETPSNIIAESRRRIAEGLEQESKEELERLRIALETEQVNQLIQYHANSLAQSRVSFWFSIGAATFGFIVIIVSVFVVLFGESLQAAIIGVVSGAIIDAVAALFFAQSHQARRLMTEFFDKLRTDRQFNESLRLCDSVSQESVQSNIKAQLALFLAGVPANYIFGAQRKLDEVPPKDSKAKPHEEGT